MHRVLIVDPDPALRLDLARSLQVCGFEAEAAASLDEAIGRLESRAFGAALVDLGDGIEHHEEGEKKRHDVAIRREPAKLIVLGWLLLLPCHQAAAALPLERLERSWWPTRSPGCR